MAYNLMARKVLQIMQVLIRMTLMDLWKRMIINKIATPNIPLRIVIRSVCQTSDIDGLHTNNHKR